MVNALDDALLSKEYDALLGILVELLDALNNHLLEQPLVLKFLGCRESFCLRRVA